MTRTSYDIIVYRTSQQIGTVMSAIGFEGIISTVITLKYPNFFAKNGIGFQRSGMIFPNRRDSDEVHISLPKKNLCTSTFSFFCAYNSAVFKVIAIDDAFSVLIYQANLYLSFPLFRCIVIYRMVAKGSLL